MNIKSVATQYWRSHARGLRVVAVVLLALLVLLALAGWADRRYPLPAAPHFSTVVLDRQGEPLRAFADEQGIWRYPVTLDEVSPEYLQLLINYEDRWFYWHPGINPVAIVRAFWQNVSNGEIVSGGSTLTMQVARLLEPEQQLTGQRTYLLKLRQIARALQLEWHYSKAQILTLYLNLAPFGGPLSGVQAASFSYFGKPVRQLSDAEAALLAVLPQRPSALRPDRYPQRAHQARDKVLQRMAELGVWPAARVADALIEPVSVLRQRSPMLAPLLARRLHDSCADCQRIQSTLKVTVQRQVEQAVQRYLAHLPPAQSVAALVVDNSDMSVLAYVGSADFLSEARAGHVDMVQAVRSPGSTLKPFLYGMALDQGLIHSASLLIDAPRFDRAYRPHNFSGGFNGPVSASEALQRSLNIPAVQLLDHIGAGRFASQLQHGGLQLFGPGARQPNESLILGGIGVRLEQLVGSYAALARGGKAALPRLTLQQPLQERYLLSPGAAWIVWRMLAHSPYQVIQRLTGDSWNLAWKTGTSYGFRDAWAVGVTQGLTIGVWVGRPDGSPSPGEQGSTAAAPLLFSLYSSLASAQGRQALLPPASVSQAEICWPLGTLASASENQHGNCMRKMSAWLLDGTVPPTLAEGDEIQLASLLERVWLQPDTGLRAEPACAGGEHLQEQQVALWPMALEPWLPRDWRRSRRLPGVAEECGLLGAEQLPLQITTLPDGAEIQQPGRARVPIPVNLHADGGSGERAWYLNGAFIGRSSAVGVLPYSFNQPGPYQLSVTDQQGNTDMINLVVKMK
ncbi:penicillin-binding protein 1C [Pokkaliibacter plantistimulans]|uniref:peptidoglycan glycosyltransferase n=1 Tax=Proteobacteria bacterium 228 TaxID=2083153 RepID=A0A2S5KTZ1_9PROT|nr:penicillin-binding protein 1C [Pokkaliibacter plantistimulans]PPC78112.1 penicillin-binding protein 1C [Pokkaliibacter plantistimulans]